MSLTPDELRELAYYRAHARHVTGVARDRFHDLARRDDGQAPADGGDAHFQRQTLKVFRGALAPSWRTIFPVLLVTTARALLQCLWHVMWAAGLLLLASVLVLGSSSGRQWLASMLYGSPACQEQILLTLETPACQQDRVALPISQGR